MEKLYEFKPQDNKGKIGEKLFADTYSEFGPIKQEAKSWIDFVLKTLPPWTTKPNVEVKFDDMSQYTGNIFVEEFVVKHEYYPGGPWRAIKSDANYVHYVLYNNTFYWFDAEKFIDWIGRAGISRKPGAYNKDGSSVGGYIIPIDRIDELKTDILIHKQVYDKTRKTDSNPRTPQV
ncbi:MAG: hypothetical protein NTY03_05035 [Candidatus Bathyarchaeota archaeon]|nr:hypothetical protein [Candidatus Bathyarchaeota archaeon]